MPRSILAHGAGAGQHSTFMTSLRHRPRGARRRRRHVQLPLYRAAPAHSRSAAGARSVLRGGDPGGAVGRSTAARRCSSAASRWAGGSRRTSRPTAWANRRSRHRAARLSAAPAGPPEERRDAHLPDVRCPMLFVQGSRDTFGTPAELEPVLATLRAPATLHVVDGGDHSFKVAERRAAAGRGVSRRAAGDREVDPRRHRRTRVRKSAAASANSSVHS